MPDGIDLLVSMIHRWVDDPSSAVVYAEEVDGRWAVRMTHTVRDATTVWWEQGQRTLRLEAYVGPVREHAAEHAYRLALVRNRDSWRCHFALDKDGGLVIRARVANEEVSAETLDALLGECYDLIERTFPLLVRLYRRRPEI